MISRVLRAQLSQFSIQMGNDTIGISRQESVGADTTGVLIVGTENASVDTNLDGVLLVNPLSLQSLVIPADGLDIAASIPDDPGFCGVTVYSQVLEVDNWAQRG